MYSLDVSVAAAEIESALLRRAKETDQQQQQQRRTEL
jgi:hypothetical protein